MLTVNEIFHSIQGESSYAGRPCVFVRLTACDLRCVWCDSPYAFHEGRKMSIDEVAAEVERFGCPLVEMTGGEPLLQPDLYPLMERLHASGHQVLIETGGHRSIERVPEWATIVMDVKCPGSGEAARHDATNFARLRPHDEVKFVVADRADYDYARAVLTREGAGGPRRGRASVARARAARAEDPVGLGARGPAARPRAAPGAQVHLGRRRPRCLDWCPGSAIRWRNPYSGRPPRAASHWRDRGRPAWRGRAPRRRGRPGPRRVRAA